MRSESRLAICRGWQKDTESGLIAPAHAKRGLCDLFTTGPAYWGASSTLTYSSLVLSTSPVAYLRLNDTGSALADATGNGNSGTIIGDSGLSYVESQSGLTGAAGGAAIEFKGGVATMPRCIDLTTGNWAIAFSITLRRLPNPVAAQHYCILSCDQVPGSPGNFAIFIDDSGHVKLTNLSSVSDVFVSNTTLSANTSYRVLLNSTAGVLTARINGVADSATGSNVFTNGSSSTFILGAIRQGSNQNGYYHRLYSGITELVIYSAPLSSSSDNAIYAVGGSLPNLPSVATQSHEYWWCVMTGNNGDTSYVLLQGNSGWRTIRNGSYVTSISTPTTARSTLAGSPSGAWSASSSDSWQGQTLFPQWNRVDMTTSYTMLEIALQSASSSFTARQPTWVKIGYSDVDNFSSVTYLTSFPYPYWDGTDAQTYTIQ